MKEEFDKALLQFKDKKKAPSIDKVQTKRIKSYGKFQEDDLLNLLVS